jgi:C-terminal processing protease CtpA/Prc
MLSRGRWPTLSSLLSLGLVAVLSEAAPAQSLPRLGVALEPVQQGARIVDVERGSAAAQHTKMRRGDLITSVNGWRIHNVPQLKWVIAHSKVEERNNDGDTEVRYKLRVHYRGRRRSEDGTIMNVRRHVTVRLEPVFGGPTREEPQEKPQERIEEPEDDQEP